MNNIITPQEFSQFRNVSKKLDTDKINECIKLAQNIDLYDVLGEFYFDLLANLDNPDYADLLSGNTFIVNGENYYQSGLKSLIADYTYARYIYTINVNLTPFGATYKDSQDSQTIDRNMLKDLTKQTQIDASIKFKMIDKYLMVNKVKFPRYKNNNNPDINTFGQKFTIIK